MTELLTSHPQSIAIAVALALAMDLARRLFLWLVRGARRFWFGSGPEALKIGWVPELCSYLLYPVLAFFAFVFSLAAIIATATLMGFDPRVRIAALAHGSLMLWVLVATFLWLQVWYLMSLPGFWRRLRYVLLLAALPMALQVIAWLVLEAIFRLRLADSETLKLGSLVSRLLCLGVFPFLMPLVHRRVLAPVFTHFMELAAPRWRPRLTAIGSVALAVVVLGTAWSVSEASRRALFARSELTPVRGTAPVSIGAPHTCNAYYPPFSVRMGEEGTAIVAFRITTTGSVKDVAVVRSTGSPRLDLASVLCATHWTYIPATVNGQAVERPWKAEIVWKMN